MRRSKRRNIFLFENQMLGEGNKDEKYIFYRLKVWMNWKNFRDEIEKKQIVRCFESFKIWSENNYEKDQSIREIFRNFIFV